MSLPINLDNSVQPSLTFTGFGDFDGLITSNTLYTSSNELNTKINLKQDTLTAGTNLLGVGSAITALDWNKITLNKPINFQSDWNTTIINKPIIYTQTETNNLLNAKEQILSFTAPLTRTTNTIGINLSSYSTTGTDANYLLKTGGTMTGAIVNTSTTASDFKGIYIMHTARQSHLPYLPNGNFYFRAPVIIDNSADYLSFGSRLGDNFLRLFGSDYGFGVNDSTLRYNVPAGAVHRFYNGTTNTAWINDAGRLKATTFEGSGSALTNVPYASITSVPDFLLKSGGTLTGLLSGTTINATTALQEAGTNLSSKYLTLSGGTLTGTLNGTTIYTTGNIGVGTNNNIASLVVGSIDADGSDGSIAFSKRQNAGIRRNFKMGMNGDYSFCIGDYGANNTANIWSNNYFSIRYADGNIGIGIQGSASYKLYVEGATYFNGNSIINGTCSAGTFSGNHTGNGSGLTNLPLSGYSLTGQDTNYLLKTGGVMTGQITGITTLNGTTGIFGTISTTNNTNANTPQLGAYGGTGDRIILYAGTASVHPYSLGINNGVLWYSVPASSSHIFYVAGNSITTINSTGLSTTGIINASTNLQETGINLTSKYLKLDGTNTMSAPLNITSPASDNQIVITNTTTTRYVSIKFFNGTAQCFMGVGGSGLTGTSYYNNNLFLESANSLIFQTAGQTTANVPRMIINTSGNVGIATTNPNNILQVADGARLRISNGVNDYSLIGTKDVDDNTNTRIVISGNTRSGIYAGRIEYLATSGDHIFYTNAINERMRILNNGNIGINNTNPRTLLHIRGTAPALTIMGAGGVGATTQLNLSTYDHTTNAPNCSLIATDNGNFGSTFQINQKTSGADANTQFTSLFINDTGNVGIGTITTIDEKLHLHTTGTNNAFIKANASGQGQSGLRLFAGSGTSNRATRIDFFNNVASPTIARWTLISGGDQNGTDDFRIYNAGGITNVLTLLQSGFVGVNTTTPKSHLYVNGKAGINNGSEYAITAGFMASGSLTIGGQNANYGCGNNWNSSTAGLLMECLDNTEIAIHDSGNRVVSAIAYYGGGTNRIYIGRDMFWGSTPVTIPNSLTIDGSLDFGSRIQDYIINLWGSGNYGFGINGGTLRYNSDGVHKFYCGGAESSTITNKGIVIGTYGTQYYPFIVNKTINGTLSYVFVRTGWNGGSDYNTNSITGDTSASFAGQIHVSGNILNSSDIRIKKEINDINDDGALQQILAIQPKTYKYIDYLSKNNKVVYGFIAQQVKEVIPHAVELVKDIIPNIYKRAICDSNIITLENDVSQELNLNDNIKIYDEFGNDNMYNITEINENVIKIDKDINTSNVFVFGKEVDDFHTLKKDYIFTLNVCATQELYKLIQKQNEIIEELKGRISALEAINH